MARVRDDDSCSAHVHAQMGVITVVTLPSKEDFGFAVSNLTGTAIAPQGFS
jgi:hypothetical protein